MQKTKNPLIQELLGVLFSTVVLVGTMVYGFLNPYEGERITGVSLAVTGWVVTTIMTVIYFFNAFRNMRNGKVQKKEQISVKSRYLISKITLSAWVIANIVFFLTVDYLTWISRHGDEIILLLISAGIFAALLIGAGLLAKLFTRKKRSVSE